MTLTDRVALVTGASSGIGKATAQALANEGCAVALAARRGDRLETIVSEMENGQALPVPTDVTDEDDVVAMVEQTREALGKIDLLVNNAGVIRPDPIADADRADFQQEIQVNLLGMMNATHAALPDILAAETGDIVAVSSLNVRLPGEGKGGSGYTATKFGVNGFCRALRKEVAEDGVRVTIVMPGTVDTEVLDAELPKSQALDPADVAEAIVFAVSRPNHVSISDLTITPTEFPW